MNRIISTSAFALAAAMIAAATPTASAQVGKNLGLLDPNIATQAQLQALPNMTAERVKWIVDNRPFEGMKQIDDYLKAGLDSAQRITLYEKMYLPTNLNVQVTQEIAMIPKAGRRMVHEFDEYKPYASLKVWYREIDKYIDEPLLGTMQQYVFVPMNANSATDEDLMTIPGLRPAELAAIKAGRPWSDAAKLRAEMAKLLGGEKQAIRITRYLVVAPASEQR